MYFKFTAKYNSVRLFIMMKAPFLILTLLTVFNDPPTFEVQGYIDLNDLSDTEFFEISDIHVNDKFIYVVDWAGVSVSQFDIDGNFIKKTGRHGRGPGEFDQGPRLISSVKDLVFVNSLTPWLHMYSDSLSFIENRTIVKSALNMNALLSQDSLLYMVPTQFYEPDLFIYNPFSEEVSELYLDFELEPGILGKYTLNRISNHWIFSWYFKNQFIVYDSLFNSSREFSLIQFAERAAGNIHPIKNMPKNPSQYHAKLWSAGTFIPSSTLFTSFINLDNEYLLIQLGLMNSTDECIIIDMEGNIIQSLKLPSSKNVLLDYSDGILYMKDRNSTKIKGLSLLRSFE